VCCEAGLARRGATCEKTSTRVGDPVLQCPWGVCWGSQHESGGVGALVWSLCAPLRAATSAALGVALALPPLSPRGPSVGGVHSQGLSLDVQVSVKSSELLLLGKACLESSLKLWQVLRWVPCLVLLSCGDLFPCCLQRSASEPPRFPSGRAQPNFFQVVYQVVGVTRMTRIQELGGVCCN